MNPPSFEFETVPSPLRDGVVTLTRQLLASPELAAFPDDPELRTQLLRVLTASPYAADILVRYPVMLAELLGSKRLQSTTTADAYLSLLQATLPPDPDEEELQRRLRLLQIAHRLIHTGLCLAYRRLQGARIDVEQGLAFADEVTTSVTLAGEVA